MITALDQALVDAARARLTDAAAAGTTLDLTRGKPAAAQLDLAAALLGLPGPDDYRDDAGTDLRNYGGLLGVAQMRGIFAELLGVEADQVIASGNSSLELMHETVTNALLFGRSGQPGWLTQAQQTGRPVRFICPVPGYDRHFQLTEALGIEMVTVEWGPAGPDPDEIAGLAADEMVKGLWLVPQYSNPTGLTASEECVRALLRMPAADDFMILWDNAYAVHALSGDAPAAAPVLVWAAEEGHPERVIGFASTSKISFAGAGIAVLTASVANVEWWASHAQYRRIGPDKINQWRHVRFFGDADGLRAHMRRHADILAPKFAAVQEVLAERLHGLGIAEWTDPDGGYFVTLTVPDGCASRVVALAGEAGVKLTPAGACHPHGRDPRDRVIRLAPSMPTETQVRAAMGLVADAVVVASAT